MGLNKMIFHALAALFVLVVVQRQADAADYKKPEGVKDCQEIQEKLGVIIKNVQNEVISKPSADYQEKQRENWIAKFNYKSTAPDFEDILNKCLNSVFALETTYKQCIDEYGKKDLLKYYLDQQPATLTEDMKTFITTDKCVPPTVNGATDDLYKTGVEWSAFKDPYAQLLKLKDDEIITELKKTFTCEKDISTTDPGNKFKKCVDLALKKKASQSTQSTSIFTPKTQTEKCDMVEMYYKAIKSDQQRKSYPSAKFDRHSFHYKIDLMLLDAWKGEKLYEDISESLDCDWILPRFRHNKKDVINCMHETKTNSHVINDILECVYSHDLKLKPTYSNYNAFKKTLQPYMKKYEEFKDRCKLALKKEEEETLDKFIEEYDSLLQVQKNRKDIETVASDCVNQNKHRGTSLLTRKMKQCVGNRQIAQVCGQGDFFCDLVKDFVFDFDDDDDDDYDDDEDNSSATDYNHQVHHPHTYSEDGVYGFFEHDN